MQRSRGMLARASTIRATSLGDLGAPPILANADSIDDAAATIVSNDPFRLSNKPASIRYLSAAAGAAPPVPIRPQFALKAIIGGPPWSAIVEGIPGQSGGIVVTAGLDFDKLHVKAITRDTVVMQAPDTIWKLTLRANP
ncbi:MAG TPA: hypothetical protein VF929_11830 [Gemmatimonadaceae bacterium]